MPRAGRLEPSPSQRCPTGSSRRFRARRRAAVPRSGPSSTTRIRVPRRLWPRGGTARPGRSSTSPFRPPRIMARSVTCRARQPRRASRWGRSRTVPISPRPSPSAGTAPAGRSSGSPSRAVRISPTSMQCRAARSASAWRLGSPTTRSPARAIVEISAVYWWSAGMASVGRSSEYPLRQESRAALSAASHVRRGGPASRWDR